MNAASGVGLLVALASLLACISWIEQSRTGRVFPSRGSLAIAGWAALAGVDHALLASGAVPGAISQLLQAGSGVLLFAGVVSVARVVVVAGSLASPVAESALVATAVVAVGWGLAGPARSPIAVFPALFLLVSVIAVTALMSWAI